MAGFPVRARHRDEMATFDEQPVELSIAEPWKLASAPPGSAWISGTAVAAGGNDGPGPTALAVHLESPLEWGGDQYSILIVSARGEAAALEDCFVSTATECNFRGVPSDEDFDELGVEQLISRWRGGLAGIATLRPSGLKPL